MTNTNLSALWHHNDLNKIYIKGFTSSEFSIFLLLLEQMQKQNRDIKEFNNTIRVELKDIKKALEKYDKMDRAITKNDFVDSIRDVFKKLAAIHFSVESPKKFKITNLFLSFELEDMILTAKLNEECEYLFYGLAGKFTILELEKYMRLQKIHSRHLFRLLSQWKNSRHKSFTVEIDELKLFVNAENYSTRDFTRDILNVAIKENAKYFKDLVAEPIKEGRKIVQYQFSWTKFVDEQKKVKEKPSAKEKSLTVRGTSEKQSQEEIRKFNEAKELAITGDEKLSKIRGIREMLAKQNFEIK